jgi:hypothetical protein
MSQEPLAQLSMRPAESPESRQKARFASGSYFLAFLQHILRIKIEHYPRVLLSSRVTLQSQHKIL